jgi:hypothetical protein
MYNEELKEMVSPLGHNTVAVCNQITLLILYYICSRLVTLLKITDAPVQVSDIFYVSSSSILAFRYSFIFSLKCLLVSHLHCLDYLHCFGLDPVPTAFYPAYKKIKNLNILKQTMVYGASVCTELDSL